MNHAFYISRACSRGIEPQRAARQVITHIPAAQHQPTPHSPAAALIGLPSSTIMDATTAAGAQEGSFPSHPQAATSAGTAPQQPAAHAVVHTVLGSTLPLSQISQVQMHVLGPCKMGISFWPMFSFKAPDREAKPGRVTLAAPAAPTAVAEPPASPPPAAAAAAGNSMDAATAINAGDSDSSSTAHNTGSSSSSSSNGQGSLDGSVSAGQQLLHVDFTQDPPDEFSVGAKFLGGIPFPFLSIRTTCLQGTIDPVTGKVELVFKAKFLAQLGSEAPAVLPINATLTSEVATASSTSVAGRRLEQGHCTLVSAAEVPRTNSWIANLILWLPTAATAVLPMRLDFT